MTDDLFLSAPSMELRDAYLAFYREWLESGEQMVPWVIAQDPTDFPALIAFLTGQADGSGLQAGWVPNSTYWLLNGGREVLGAVNIRNRMNEHLLHEGGHIGYGIRPSRRRRGYATRLLAMSLEQAAALGIERALVCCDQENEASARTILRNGGLTDSSYTDEKGQVVLRFWIETRPGASA
jgi:predicted acetyltransferase